VPALASWAEVRTIVKHRGGSKGLRRRKAAPGDVMRISGGTN
jgi:hypothetical protein